MLDLGTKRRRVLYDVTWCALLVVAASLAGNGQAAETGDGIRVTAQGWPEADALFHRDPRWLGGDDAYSVDLGDGRVAWFFGDSFVEPTVPGERSGTTMVRNSVGLQTGYDPTRAPFKAYWRQVDEKPASFVPEDGEEFFWPGGSLIVDGKLLMCLMRSRDTEEGLHFESTGWGAVLIDNLEASPDQWQVRQLEVPQNDFEVLVGSASLVQDGEYVVAFSVGAGSHHVYLVRWNGADAADGDLTRPEWWAGAERGWVEQQELHELPAPLMKDGQTEFTVHFSREFGCYMEFQFEGFPLTPIGVRTAMALTGPWSPLTAIYRPEEMRRDDAADLMLYAAKAHPEQATDALALTYASNAFELAQVIDSPSIYYPRFVRVTLTPPAD